VFLLCQSKEKQRKGKKMKNTLIVLAAAILLAGCTGASESPKESNLIASNFVEIETDDMVEFPYPIWNTAPISSIPMYPIKLKHSDESVVFECSVDEGTLSVFGGSYESSQKNVIAKSGDDSFSIAWYSEHTAYVPEDFSQQAFIEIILKIDNNTIGYAVVEVSRDRYIFTGKLLHSALIPKVDGKYQAVTEEQVKVAIEKIKKGEETSE
jgi:hypothetical protein